MQLAINGLDGFQLNVARIGSGHTFGEAAFFLIQNAMHDAMAASDVLLQKLSR